MSEIISEKFPGGMNILDNGIVSKLLVKNNDLVQKGQEIAIITSNNYEMSMHACVQGKIEIFISNGQVIQKNDILWKINTTFQS